MARRKIELNSSARGALIDMKTGKPLSEIPVICERIRYFREMKKMEQKLLAANIGVTANSVSNMKKQLQEKGLWKITKVFPQGTGRQSIR